MNKKKTLIFATLLAASGLTGCEQKVTKVEINIGSKIGQSTELVREVDLTALLSSKIGEGVLLATYSKSMSTGCSCWTGFKEEVINKYVKNYNVPIYYFDTDKLNDTTISKYKINKLTSSNPSFYIYKDGKVVKNYKYSEKSTGIFSYKNFAKEMDNMLEKPEKFQLYYVDENYLFTENHINDEKNVVFTERNACGDCSYILPKFIIPYSKDHTFKQDLLVLDIQSYNWNGNDSEDYRGIISKMKLDEASNADFGFGRGFVPTTQYYQNGELKDACVTFNDSLESNGNNYKVNSTYYTQSRLEKLTFLKNSDVETKVLENLDVPASDTDEKYHFWSHEAASKYHEPILEAFLKAYCL